MAARRRLLRARDSLAHGWADGTITAFQPGFTYYEDEVLEGEASERAAFFNEAVSKHLFDDVTEEEEQDGGGRRTSAGAGRKASQ